MTRYQLAKLVTWAGTMHGRKRLQKVAFLLQAVGCPLEEDFFLHFYGPYSEGLARRTDELVREGLFAETMADEGPVQRYSYRLTETARRQLDELEQTERGQRFAAQLAPFEPLARSLVNDDLKDLEIAATVFFFREQSKDWAEALQKTRAFKHLSAESPLLARGENLARKVEAGGRPAH